jgi:hypothetical protein
MSVDQMLKHLNQSLENSLGRVRPKPMKLPMPLSVARFAIFNLPWPKGAPTPAEYVAGGRYNFTTERDRCLRLIDEMTKRSLDDTSWGQSAAMGQLTGAEWSRLQAKHLDHHLKHFGL